MTDKKSSEIENSLYSDIPLTDEKFESLLDKLAELLLFGTRWNVSSSLKKGIRSQIPILGDVPLICKGTECPYAPKCNTIKKIKDEVDLLRLIGSECREDKIFGIEQFAAFVKDLQIDPEQTTDVINVASLVRLLILKRRIDWSLAIEGLVEQEPNVVNQSTGQVYFKRVVHPLFKVSESLEKQIASVQKQLMADRQARASLAMQAGKSIDVLKNALLGNLEQFNPIDAEFSINNEEEEV